MKGLGTKEAEKKKVETGERNREVVREWGKRKREGVRERKRETERRKER